MSQSTEITVFTLLDQDCSLDELCEVLDVSQEFILELVQFGTLEPLSDNKGSWRFTPQHINRVRMAKRLHHDLEVNHPGIALALDLMQEIVDLKTQLQVFERFFYRQ